MNSYTKENRGALWGNDKKEKDTQPDFTGNLTIDGVEYHVSAWRRKDDAKPRSPALTFSVKRKDDVHKEGMQQAQEALKPQQQQYMEPQQQEDDNFDDTLPF